ncbi:TonB-dependent receptor [Vibrio fluvialis]|nr:TonB-dependent receptor [Vibrio fluvialis]EKO3425228.1 TonB-dependent receptor [Vibrio fluvialis]ELX7500526.1 TonB-dependent receptor [Vibrio fluvialis]MBY7874086.1 TonB-dependent receptor [Vibrio fluvialis]MBY7878903.1 TonB-dependent receptor [Vibrio fluvialis]
MDKKFVTSSLGYAILGMLLGIYMAASHNHGQLVTHAHIMLAGFVVSFIYGLCHKLWLTNGDTSLAKVQFWIHQLGVLIMVVGLFLLYGQFIAMEVLDPILALSSILVLVGMVLMKVLFIRSKSA